jgi:streptogramin lyase
MLRGGWLALFFAGFSLISLSNRAPGQSAPVLREVIADHPQLPMPFGFAFTPDRALIVSDYKKHQIVRVDPGQTPRVKVLAGNGTAGNSDGTGSRAQLNSPHDVVRLADGRFLVADTFNHRVCQVDPQTGALTTVAGEGGKGFAGDGGAPEGARFFETYHLAATPKGTDYLLVDLGNRRIRRVGVRVSTIAGNGARAVPKDGDKASESPLLDPRACAMDGHGLLYILERGGNALRVVDNGGKIRTVAGTGKAGPLKDGPALECPLNSPKYIWIERNGKVLIADSSNHAIRRYDPSTNTLTTVAGTGQAGKGPAGADPLKTELKDPHAVTVSPDGVITIADSGNARILEIR